MACPWSCACDSPPPLIKVASNTRSYSKLGGTTMNGREEGGQYYILQTCDQERFEARKVVFPWECLNIFATSCSNRLHHCGTCMIHSVPLFLKTSGGTFCRARQPSIYRLVVHRRNVCGHSCQWIRSSRSNYSLIHGSSFSVCWSWRPW